MFKVWIFMFFASFFLEFPHVHNLAIWIWQCVKTLYPCSSHQNSWDLWMFIPLKMVLIGIDPYPYVCVNPFNAHPGMTGMMAMANLAAPRAIATPRVAPSAWRATGPVHRGGPLGATVAGAKAWAMAESMVFFVLSDHPAC
jgi:hypothetical protein